MVAKKKMKSFEEILQGALKNEKYNWRTVSGIAKEIDEQEKNVEIHLEKLDKQGIVIVGRRNSNNEKIYSLKKSYKSRNSLTVRLKDVVSGGIKR